jgi:hypothetical protein
MTNAEDAEAAKDYMPMNARVAKDATVLLGRNGQ